MFNDPYDCALGPNLQPPTDADVETIRQYCLSQSELPIRARGKFETHSVERLRASFLRAAKEAFTQLVHGFLTNRGVACFSERNDDLLMWSHYGGQYKAFCLEFDTSPESFSRIHRVQYESVFPPLSVARVLMNNDYHHVQD